MRMRRSTPGGKELLYGVFRSRSIVTAAKKPVSPGIAPVDARGTTATLMIRAGPIPGGFAVEKDSLSGGSRGTGH
jgi:hypothetical protein